MFALFRAQICFYLNVSDENSTHFLPVVLSNAPAVLSRGLHARDFLMPSKRHETDCVIMCRPLLVALVLLCLQTSAISVRILFDLLHSDVTRTRTKGDFSLLQTR